MNIAGIIAEYNPLHSGHLYLLQQARKQCDAQYVVCVMSASFVQRGQPAMFDKFVRTAAALAAGADMVLELPCAYSLQAAPFFARGAVKTLAASGLATHLVFGAERPEALLTCAAEPERFRSQMDSGVCYARAACADTPALSHPNSLLGIEYLRALAEIESGIKAVAVERIGAAHGSEGEENAFFSASAVRRLFVCGKREEAFAALPAESAEALRGAPFCLPESAFVPLLCRLRMHSAQQLRNFAGMSEGIEYRVRSAAEQARSLEELILSIKSKRYTYARISRMLMSVFIGLTAEETALANEAPPYVRVLGVRKESKELLSLLCKRSSVPVVTCVQDFLQTVLEGLLQRELYATDIRAALCMPPQNACADKTAGLIIV